MNPAHEGRTTGSCSLGRSVGEASRARVAVLLWCAVVAMLVGSWSTPAIAGNPDVRWRTIETEHFYIHYWVGNEDAAERTALIAEKAHRELTTAWGHRPFLKTHVVLSDVTDTANGSATAAPYARVTAYITAPSSLSVLEAYDDWLDILITHELVHIVHLDTVHGLYRAVNAVLGFGVLGKVTQPNIVQPRWIVEGVATVHESEYSSRGRRRSAQFDAFMRMSVLDGSFQAIDQVSSGARIFPHGSSVYLYGLHFMYYIRARYGQDKLRELSHLYATQLVPYGINKAIERVLGVTFYELWNEFKADTTRRFEAQARRIRRRGLRQGRRLTFAGEETRYPMWSADDQYIYFFKNDGHREEGLKRIEAAGGRIREGVGIGRQGVDVDVEHVIDMETSGQASFVGATGDVVYEQEGVYDFRYRWSDLHRHNGGDPKQAEQLTFGMRAFEPHVSPDGRTVAFRRNDAAQSRLAFLDLDTGDVTEVPPLERLAQVYTPRWHPDGRRVAFSGSREGGYRDIYLYDRDTGALERITADRHIDMLPNWSPDGRYLVFTSDRDDVYNVYAYDMEMGTLHQVTNVLGGAFDAAISHDGKKMAYIGYGRAAYDLWVMDFDPDDWLAVAPSMASLPLAEDPRPPLPGGDGRPLSLGSRRYRPIETLYPRTIFPTALDLQAASSLGQSIGFETGVQDVLGWHTLLGNFNYVFDQRLATGAASYTYSRLWPDFTFVASRGFGMSGGFTRYRYDRPEDPEGGSYLSQGFRQRTTQVSGTTTLPVVRHPRHRADFSFGYQWMRFENLDAGDLPIDPNAPASILPQVGDLADVSVGALYTNEADGAGRFTYGVETGRAASVRVSFADERLGGDFGNIAVTASYRETIPMPWRGHQSLVLSLRGGSSAGQFRGGFCVGDYQAGMDAVRSILQRIPFGAQGCSLVRGYAPAVQRGRHFGNFTTEYRIPLVDVDRGLGTLPLFFQRIGMIPFVDTGSAWTEPIRLRDVLVGAGASLVFSFRLGYAEGIHLFLQYAHGFDGDVGVDSFRTVISSSF
jgi:hypothetical protein